MIKMVKLLAIGWNGVKSANVTPMYVSIPNYFNITEALGSIFVLGKSGIVINGAGDWYVKWNGDKVTDVSTAVVDRNLLEKKGGNWDYDPKKAMITKDYKVVRKSVKRR